MVFFLTLILQAHCFKFYVPASQEFCFGEDLSSDTLSVFLMNVSKDVGLKIVDPAEFVLYHRTASEHLFSFTALDQGIYRYCVVNELRNILQVDIELKTGVRAKDYSGIASTKNLQKIELKMRKLEDQTKEIHKKIQVLREREEQMRNTNTTIHNRVIGYSVCTVLMLLCLALIQILYLKRYFRAKKMI